MKKKHLYHMSLFSTYLCYLLIKCLSYIMCCYLHMFLFSGSPLYFTYNLHKPRFLDYMLD